MGASSMRSLLLAALDSFANLGYHGTSTRDIANRAKMSPAAIYMHYESKEQLLYQISKTTHEAMLAEMRRVFALPATPVERLRNIVKSHASFHATMHTATRVANYELRPLSEEHWQEILRLRRGMEEVIREALRLGVVSGDFEVDDLDMTKVMLVSLGIDICRWYSEGGRLTPEQIGEMYAINVLRMVKAQQAAAAPGVKKAVEPDSQWKLREALGPAAESEPARRQRSDAAATQRRPKASHGERSGTREPQRTSGPKQKRVS